MKLLSLILLLVALSANAQDKVVLHGDTIPCRISSIEATGVAFMYENQTRRMGLEIVDAIYYRGRWLNNHQVRNLAADDMVGREIEPKADPIVKLEYPEQSVALYLERSGKLIQFSVIALVAGSVGTYLLAPDYPDLAILIGSTGVVGSLVTAFFAGNQLRKSARILHNQ